MRICACVVTYNRLEKLKNCLAALGAQTVSLASVIVVDNASTDGTAAFFAANPLYPFALSHERLPRNSGGAGGFAHALRCFLSTDADAAWLMDDDCLPQASALAELLDARARALAVGVTPDITASRVIRHDGTPHPWNIPQSRRAGTRQYFDLVGAGLLPIRSASFASILIRRAAVAGTEPPCASYFIYNDDIEYTGRILREGQGVLAPRSICLHDTAEDAARFVLPPHRLRFEVRNKLWMILRSPAWTMKERLYYALLLGKNIALHLRPSRAVFANCPAVLRGIGEGLFCRPERTP